MAPKFNIDRPKVSDEEIKKHQNFGELVKQFKKQSLKQAQGDESWRKNKKVRYSTVIAGITVVCTVTLSALYYSKKTNSTHETLTTSKSAPALPAASSKSPATATAKKQPRFISPPSASWRIPSQRYQVNNAAGATLKHPSSSRIKVPKGAFVDKAGKTVVGEVTIEYRELHDAADIILSGIPMAYDSAGHKFNLETAGMFEITGTQNGEPVFIHPGKPLEIELASRTSENRFNQYYLDTAARNWTYLKRDQAQARSTLQSTPQRPAAGTPETVNTPGMDLSLRQIKVTLPKQIDSVKNVYSRKIRQLPSYKAPLEPRKADPKRPTFNLDGSYDEFPELAAFKNVLFEVGPENRNYSKKMHEITWSDIRVAPGPVQGKNFWLTLIYRNEVEKLVVYPVLSGDNYTAARARYEELFEDYSRLQSKREEDEKRLLAEMQKKQQVYLDALQKKQADYELARKMALAEQRRKDEEALNNTFSQLSQQARATRLFSVSRFGIYNSDCPHPWPTAASLRPVFVYSGGTQFLQPEQIYLIDHTLNSVYLMNPKEQAQLNYQPANAYSILALAKGRLFVCTRQGFKDALAAGHNKFAVTAVSEEGQDLDSFRKTLEL